MSTLNTTALSVGFDYGTSHCAMGTMDRARPDRVKLIPLSTTSPLVASTLFTWDRSLIYRFVAEHMQDADLRRDHTTQFSTFLNRSKRVLTELGIDNNEAFVLFGQEAFDQYAKDPSDGHYLRSPKSFLGSTGLSAQQLLFIEHVVTAMMMRFKSIAEAHCDVAIENVVIGRPINFQGLRGEESNRQAIQVLRQASQRAGFKHVEFLYEPLAAGIDFESRLERDRTVLVVDIGGGTSDCSMIRMGPSRRVNTQRESDFLAHCGQRVGGNDFDIHLSFHRLMPLLGSQSALRTGKPIPMQPFWCAVETNDAGSQLEFYSDHYAQLLQTLQRDSEE
ncbi:MAG: molecular chaperone, partial [Gammaproteobacteria bacterium]